MDNQRALSVRIVRVISIFILYCMFATACGWAADNDQVQKTITGKINDVDWVKSTVTVRYTDPDSGVADEIEIFVPDTARIMNGPELKKLSDIEQGDPVTVIYYNNGFSGLRAKSVMDLNDGNR